MLAPVAARRKERVPWDIDEDGNQSVNISDVCGGGWWAALEGVVNAITCGDCRQHGQRLLSGMHDLVNHRLGKAVHDPKNFHQVALEYLRAQEDLHTAPVGQMGQANIRVSGTCTDAKCAFKVRGTGETVTADVISPAGLEGAISEVQRFLDQAHQGHGGAGGAGPTVADREKRVTFAMGPEGTTRYIFQFSVVSLDRVTASHNPFTFAANPDYPQELQPRLRDRAATRIQVERIAENLDPEALLTDFHTLDRGAPIVGPDLVVESGNGRTMALKIAADDDSAQYSTYVARLRELVQEFGYTPGDVDGLEYPVLVRVRLSEVDRKTFAEEANTSAAIGQSAIEQARSDASKITVEMLTLLVVGDNQSIDEALRSPANRSFVTSYLNKLPDTDQARLVDGNGRINTDAVRRMVMGIFVSVFGAGDQGLRLAEAAFESIDLETRNVFNGIARALGKLAEAEGLAREGLRDDELQIGPDLAAAATTYAAIKRTPGQTVRSYLDQGQLFDRQLTPFQEDIVLFLDQRARSARRIGLALRHYADSVINQPPPAQGELLPAARAGKEELWREAVARGDEADAGPRLFQEVLLGQLHQLMAQGDQQKPLKDYPTCRGDLARAVRQCIDLVSEAQGQGLDQGQKPPHAVCQMEAGCLLPHNYTARRPGQPGFVEGLLDLLQTNHLEEG